MTDKFPSVTQQGFKVWRHMFAKWPKSPRYFNGSVCDFNGKTFLATRKFNGKDGRCDIGIAEVDQNFDVIGEVKTPELWKYTNTAHQEDPRLFVHKDALWMSYVHVYNYNAGRYSCSQIAVRFNEDLDIDRTLAIDYGNNFSGLEKNWTFLSHEDKLYFIYNLKHEHICEVDDNTGEVLRTHERRDVIKWPYGSLSGGTQLIDIGDEYLGFLHGFIPEPGHRRYNMSAFTLEKEFPFKMSMISREPILVGSAEDGYINEPNMFGWMPRCVFPCGVVQRGDKYIISAGVNDSYVFFIEMSLEDMKLVDAQMFTSEFAEYYKCENINQIPTWIKSTKIGDVNNRSWLIKADGISAKSRLFSEPHNVEKIMPKEYRDTIIEEKKRTNTPRKLTYSAAELYAKAKGISLNVNKFNAMISLHNFAQKNYINEVYFAEGCELAWVALSLGAPWIESHCHSDFKGDKAHLVIVRPQVGMPSAPDTIVTRKVTKEMVDKNPEFIVCTNTSDNDFDIAKDYQTMCIGKITYFYKQEIK